MARLEEGGFSSQWLARHHLKSLANRHWPAGGRRSLHSQRSALEPMPAGLSVWKLALMTTENLSLRKCKITYEC